MKTSEQAYAYTPGLKIKRQTIVAKVRKLPIRGEVLVGVGDLVSHDTIVAEGSIPGDPVMVNAAFEIDVEPDALRNYVVKNVGEAVRKGDIIARTNSIFGLFKTECRSPIDGTIELVSDLSGQIVIRGSPVKIAIDAYVPGKVTSVIPSEGAIIETNAALVQGILGIGGEAHGKIRVLASSPRDVLGAENIPEDVAGHVLVGGSNINFDAIMRAVKAGVRGIVTGGIEPADVTKFLGTEIGVAITGEEETGLTLIITEGFGQMPMSQRTFDLLKSFEGHMAAINGATQIRAGVMRPEVVIPHEKTFEQISSADQLAAGMVPGTIVRIIREPYFGAIGKVHSLPVELKRIETESEVRVLEVELDDGRIVTVPRANVEIIEE